MILMKQTGRTRIQDNQGDGEVDGEDKDNQGNGEGNMPEYDPDDPSSPWYLLRHVNDPGFVWPESEEEISDDDSSLFSDNDSSLECMEGDDPTTPRNAVPPDKALISRQMSRGIAGPSMKLIGYTIPLQFAHIGLLADRMPIGSFATVATTRDDIRVLLIFNDYVHGGCSSESLRSVPRLEQGGSIIDLENSHWITLPINSDLPIIDLEYSMA